jgi:hypothetical protein
MRIRRGLGSRRLRCGCVVGVYETYRDEVVTILDATGPGCEDRAHLAGNVLPTLDIREAVPPDATGPAE